MSNFTTTRKDVFDSQRKSELIVFPLILLIVIVGCIGNGLILILFQKIQTLFVLPNRILIQNLAMLDILQNIFHDLLVAYFLFEGSTIEPSIVLCKFTQTVGAMVFPTGYWCVWAISLLRFCHCRGYTFYFRYRSQLTLCLSIWPWIVGFLLSIPGNVDFIKVYYSNNLYACLWDPKDKFSLQVIIFIFTLHLPIVTTAFFNLFFFFFPTCVPLTREQRNVIRSTVVIVIMNFMLQWPVIITMSINNGHLPASVYPWTAFAGLLRSSANVAVYTWNSNTFRKGLIMFCKRNSFDEINNALKPQSRIRFRRRQQPLMRRQMQFFQMNY